jgi:colicin import membrane protein
MKKLFLVYLMMLAGSAWAEEASSKEQETQLRRLRKLAESSGYDSGYANRLRERIKPYILFPESDLLLTQGNPVAEIQVMCDQSGKILSWEMTRSSGNDAWDNSVMKAVEKTGTLPLDENGYIPPRISFSFRPKNQ